MGLERDVCVDVTELGYRLGSSTHRDRVRGYRAVIRVFSKSLAQTLSRHSSYSKVGEYGATKSTARRHRSHARRVRSLPAASFRLRLESLDQPVKIRTLVFNTTWERLSVHG